MSSPFLIGTPVDFEQVILADVEELLVSESLAVLGTDLFVDFYENKMRL